MDGPSYEVVSSDHPNVFSGVADWDVNSPSNEVVLSTHANGVSYGVNVDGPSCVEMSNGLSNGVFYGVYGMVVPSVVVLSGGLDSKQMHLADQVVPAWHIPSSAAVVVVDYTSDVCPSDQ